MRLARQPLSHPEKSLGWPLAPGTELGCSVLTVGLRAEIKGKGREEREGRGGDGEGKRRGKENNSTGKKSHSETLLKILLINSAIPFLGINTK